MVKSEQIKKLAQFCRTSKDRVRREQYKNSTYSRAGGDNAISNFEVLEKQLWNMYETILREEILAEAKPKVIVAVVD